MPRPAGARPRPAVPRPIASPGPSPSTGSPSAIPTPTSTSLHDVNLAFAAGSTVALVGENGAGKTTLIKLLTKMYAPTAGSIGIDGADLAGIATADWRQRTTATFQDLVRFELTAGETVGIGDLPRIDDVEAIDTALDRASATDVVGTLREGLSTRLGRSFAGGQELSGGQWQKLALARGMMRETPLLVVLDEPTASLDAMTEHALFERYASAAKRAGPATAPSPSSSRTASRPSASPT